MGVCWKSDCMGDAHQRCSGCKTATYCNDECQKSHWPLHKKECKLHRAAYDAELKREEEEKKNPSPKPPKSECRGCKKKFKKNWIEVDQECPDCGYLTCESCSCHNDRGTCYCNDSNFGQQYCAREPRPYHFGRKGKYTGDHHPAKKDLYELNREDLPDSFEDKPRPCNRCGKVVYCLKRTRIAAAVQRYERMWC